MDAQIELLDMKTTRQLFQGGISQLELARRSGVPQSKLSLAENGYADLRLDERLRVEAVIGRVDWGEPHSAEQPCDAVRALAGRLVRLVEEEAASAAGPSIDATARLEALRLAGTDLVRATVQASMTPFERGQTRARAYVRFRRAEIKERVEQALDRIGEESENLPAPGPN